MAFIGDWLTGGADQDTKQVSKTTLLPEVKKGINRAFDMAGGLANQPYRAYQGPRVASMSDAERMALDKAKSGEGATLARNFLTGGTQRWNTGFADDYMSPFIDRALEPQLRGVREAYENILNQDRAEAASEGAFGGSRQALLEDKRGDTYLENVGDVLGRGYQAAYDQALTAFGADQDRQQRGAQVASTLTDQELNRLLTTGGLQRQIQDRSLGTAYGDFVEQRDWPMRGLDVMLRTLSGSPMPETTTTTATQPGPSPLAQIAGIAPAAIGAYQMFS